MAPKKTKIQKPAAKKSGGKKGKIPAGLAKYIASRKKGK